MREDAFFMRETSLIVTKGFDGVEPGRPLGGQVAEQHADEDRDAEATAMELKDGLTVTSMSDEIMGRTWLAAIETM